MDLKTLMDTVAPRQMEWVPNTQSDQDLRGTLEFSGQLIALFRGCGSSEPIVMEAAAELMPMQA